MSNLGVAVVIDADDDMRDQLAAVLVRAGFVVHAAAGGLEGIEAVRIERPAVVTVDVGLPDIDGFEVLRRIREFSSAYVVMLTDSVEEPDVVTALDCGADDYLLKSFSPWAVLLKIQAMMRRPRSRWDGQLPAGSIQSGTDRAVLQEEGILQHNGLTLDVWKQTASFRGSVLELTRSEFDLLRELLRGGEATRTKSDLVRALRGGYYPPDEPVPEADQHALEAHIGNLRRKLGETAGARGLLQTVHGLGYRLAPEPKKSRGRPEIGGTPWT